MLLKGFLALLCMWPWTPGSADGTCYSDHGEVNLALGKTTYPSSENITGSHQFAVDGDRLNIFIDQCFRTDNNASAAYPWLVVDLGMTATVHTIVVVSPHDHEQPRLGFKVGGSFNATTFSITRDFQGCKTRYNMEKGEVVYAYCYPDKKNGRYVAVHGDRYESSVLRICEVEVYETAVFPHDYWTCMLPELRETSNIALGKATFQSTTFGGEAGDYNSSKAVDGNDNPDADAALSCTHTEVGEANPWWVVDLGGKYRVGMVAVVNRKGFGADVLKQFAIYVGGVGETAPTFDATKYNLCAKMCSTQTNRKQVYVCHGEHFGQRVAIQMYGVSQPLAMCEVEVYGTMIEDIIPFPSLTSGLNWHPNGQELLFDQDDNTCITVDDFMANRIGQEMLAVPWDPVAKNALNDNAATFRCGTWFFVTVTHDADVKISVLIGDGKYPTVGSVWHYRPCKLDFRKVINGLTHTKMNCFCTSQSHVLIKAVSSLPYGQNTARICNVWMFWG